MEFITLPFRLRPLGQFLRQTTVKRFFPLTKRQAFGQTDLSQLILLLRDVNTPAGEKIFQQKAFFRGFRMKGKRRPANFDLKFFLQSFYTPGTEIAPGSNIIGKYLQNTCCIHHFPPVFKLGNSFAQVFNSRTLSLYPISKQ